MTGQIPIGKITRIRDCGYDEFWLQDRIVNDPSSLGLGDLQCLDRERRQLKGERLDILLKNPDPEDNSMYEVEVMLGETDETHIIRTIEYWIRERRKYPQRDHYPVLVAGGFDRRFFDVIQVLGEAIPLIAVQANIVGKNGHRVLTFHKVLDVYEEPEDTEPWRTKSTTKLFGSRKLPGPTRPPICCSKPSNQPCRKPS